jgi:hypothetical protein
MGAICAWFMFKVTPGLESIKRSNDRTTRALLLLALAMPEQAPVLEAHIKQLMEEVEADAPKPKDHVL